MIQHRKKYTRDDEEYANHSMKDAKPGSESGSAVDINFGVKDGSRKNDLSTQENLDHDRCNDEMVAVSECFS